MFAEERKQQILHYLAQQDRASVGELSEAFDVSEVTIRRDLKELEQEGLLRRTHGGALSNRTETAFEPSMIEKESAYAEEKERIAQQAYALIQPGETLLLDSGTTVHALARLLLSSEGVKVVTNSNPVLQTLSQVESIELISTGGMVRSSMQSMVGPFAEQVLQSLHVDRLFLGMNGIHLERGLTTPHLLEARIKQQMIQAAREVVLLCDSSKLGQTAFTHVAPLQAVHRLITDKGASPDIVREMEEQGVEVILT
ncbi:DeoR family transcriptional regulator [Desmospora activa DSM 45169]|uniref:DeoR family transcriptional regulator n=2 Tax=Desmospora TaxID=500614 RepID=A0A2T4Z6Q0_9BACL|nr:DeoR family transcriptional regulator [Desmospora activa DSM 45169]